MTDHQDSPLALSRVDHRLPIGDGVGDGLLHEHVEAFCERRLGLRPVESVGCDEHDRVEIAQIKQRLVRVCGRASEPLGCRPRLAEVRIVDSPDVQSVHLHHGLLDAAPVSAEPDEADPDRSVVGHGRRQMRSGSMAGARSR